jgi:hypothetical protein
MERRQILNEFTTVGTLSAAVTIWVLKLITPLLDPSKNVGWLAWIVPILAGAGTYSFIFRGSIWLYYAGMWKLVHAKQYVAGEWAYVYNDSYDVATDTWKSGADRSGVARIDHTTEDISIHGESLENTGATGTATTLRATWQSRASAIHDYRIYLLASVTSGVGTEDAFMILQIVWRSKSWKMIPRSPTKMVGHFYIPPRSSTPARYARIKFSRA